MNGVVHLAGPTGAGKSALALAVAEAAGAEIINADAFQLYRGLEILSAAPTAEEKSRVPHHLYGVLGPEEACDAARYAALAREALDGIAARGQRALVVGGSGLYLKALTHGLADLPSREAMRAELSAHPPEENVARLRVLDPAGAARMNLTNPRHVIRALEICLLTGRPASEARAAWDGPDPEGLRGVFLARERDDLYRRIDRRVLAMFDAGVVEEVRALSGVAVSTTAEKAIGLREIRALLAGESTRDGTIAAMQQATRRYAKRQGTWFRRERWLKTVCLGAEDTPDSLASEVVRAFFP